MSQAPTKQARMIGQSQLRRTEKTTQLPSAMEEEKDPHTTSITPALTEEDRTRKVSTALSHPKGHRAKTLAEVWKSMDSQDFLRISDTLTLMDVWSQPKHVTPIKNAYAEVTWLQMVDAPHIKFREKVSKISNDELLRMLYLADSIVRNIDTDCVCFDSWLAEKTAAFVKKNGVADAQNRALLCNFILSEDPEFSLYPPKLGNIGIFFRKSTYHSYKQICDGDESEVPAKIINPCMMKCRSTKSAFEYIVEARLIPLPDDWFVAIGETVPLAQPLN